MSIRAQGSVCSTTVRTLPRAPTSHCFLQSLFFTRLNVPMLRASTLASETVNSHLFCQLAVVGNDGVVGISFFIGGESTPGRAVVQSAGYDFRLQTE